jgi:hypothetical protein
VFVPSGRIHFAALILPEFPILVLHQESDSEQAGANHADGKEKRQLRRKIEAGAGEGGVLLARAGFQPRIPSRLLS